MSRHFSRAIAALTVVLACVPSPASAWVSIGPDGGTVFRIAVAPAQPATLYASVIAGPDINDGRGIYKSTDGGATWSSANGTGLGEFRVGALAVHPTNGAIVFAITDSSGVYRTTNGGGTWSHVAGVSATDARSSAIVFDPQSPSTLYAGSGNGVYKSTNGGSSWALQNTGLGGGGVTALAIDPLAPATLYASTPSGVFKTTTGAATWSASNTGLPSSGVAYLAVDPATAGAVYAADCGDGFFRSVDGGATWTPSNTGLPSATTCTLGLTVHPASGRLFLGVRDDAIHPVFASGDGGQTWTPSAVGLEGRFIETLAPGPTAPQRVYAGTEGGLAVSADGGTTWTLSNQGIRHVYTNAIALDPQQHATIYAAATADGRDAVYKSVDAGSTWTATGPIGDLSGGVFDGITAWSVAVAPTDSARVWLGTTSGVFRSTDGGATWAQNLETASVQWLAVDPTDAAIVYAATSGAGVQKSTDGGATWALANTGLPHLFSDSITIDPATPTTLYLSIDFRGVYKSVDGAASWSFSGNGLGSISFSGTSNVVVSPVDPNVLYVETDRPYRSSNAGATWSATPANGGGGRLAIDPRTTTTVYGAGGDVTVLKTSDSGASWAAISPAGLSNFSGLVANITFDPASEALYGATFDGVYRSGTSTAPCATAADCADGDLCTTDVCDPLDPDADPGTGCVSRPVVCDSECHQAPGTCNSGTGECQFFSPALPDGTACDDGNPCTFDRCVAGSCDGNPVPAVGCLAAPRSRLVARAPGRPEGNTLTWTWAHGSSSTSLFGNPLQDATYTLCVYDRSGGGGSSALKLSANVDAGALCGGTPCWRAGGTRGFRYRDRAGVNDGLTKIVLHGGVTNAKVVVQARGPRLSMPTLPLQPDVTVQLRRQTPNASGACWESVYDSGDVSRNEATHLKATIP